MAVNKFRISSSRRLKLTYLVLSVWIGLAIFAILLKADLYALAVYFTSGLPIILGYLWAETTRPSLKEAQLILYMYYHFHLLIYLLYVYISYH